MKTSVNALSPPLASGWLLVEGDPLAEAKIQGFSPWDAQGLPVAYSSLSFSLRWFFALGLCGSLALPNQASDKMSQANSVRTLGVALC